MLLRQNLPLFETPQTKKQSANFIHDLTDSFFAFQGIIQLLTHKLDGADRQFQHLFAMRMRNELSGAVRWLHQDATMHQVQEETGRQGGSLLDWRFELRVRYLPTDLSDLYEKDKVTFGYYYDQVRIK